MRVFVFTLVLTLVFSCKNKAVLTASAPVALTLIDERKHLENGILLTFPSETEWRENMYLDDIESQLFEEIPKNINYKKLKELAFTFEHMEVKRLRNANCHVMMLTISGKLDIVEADKKSQVPVFSHQFVELSGKSEALNESEWAAQALMYDINEAIRFYFAQVR